MMDNYISIGKAVWSEITVPNDVRSRYDHYSGCRMLSDELFSCAMVIEGA